MNYIIVKFPTNDKRFYYEVNNGDFLINDSVLIDLGQTKEVAQIVKQAAITQKNKVDIIKNCEQGEGVVLNKLSNDDLLKLAEIKQKAREYLPICQEKIDEYQLNMKLLDADLSYDEKKLTVYFGAESRIDFRDLALDLIRNCKKIIRLQQVGSRDEAKFFGGFGACGRKICCSSFLKNIGSVTIDMAREQNLSGGVGKISGLCGKLKCCLAFEVENYLELKKQLPALGKIIKTKDGEGKVIEHNVLAQTVKVRLKDNKITEVDYGS